MNLSVLKANGGISLSAVLITVKFNAQITAIKNNKPSTKGSFFLSITGYSNKQ
jgi:hypothetical protein